MSTLRPFQQLPNNKQHVMLFTKSNVWNEIFPATQ